MSLCAAGGDLRSLFLSCSALLRAPLSPVAISIFPDGQKDGNVPVVVPLANPEIGSLQMLDSLTQLDDVILRSKQT